MPVPRKILYVLCGAVLCLTIPATAQLPAAAAKGVRGFVYVEPFEIRKEFVLPLRDLTKSLELTPDAELDSPARKFLLATLAERLADSCPIQADGSPLAFEFDRIQFVSIDPKNGVAPDSRELVPVSDATVAAVFVITRDAPPARMEITWDIFPDDKAAVPVAMEASTGTSMEFYNHTVAFSPANPVQTWDLPDLGTAPALLTVTAPRRHALFPGFVEGSLLVFGACLLLFLARKLPEKFRTPAKLGAFIITAAAIFFFVRGLLPWTRPGNIASDDEAAAVVDALLRNVYHAFAFRDESRIFDTLATSVGGDLLEELYLDIRGDLELENSGGPRVKIHQVRLEECIPDLSASPGFKADARWTATGNVSHWGHIHPRRNKYHGELTIEPVGGRWKVTDVQILEEERL